MANITPSKNTTSLAEAEPTKANVKLDSRQSLAISKPDKTPAKLASELGCSFEIPSNDIKNCLLNKGTHKIDWNSNIILVDFSYLTFCRFFAMRTWYSVAYKDVAKSLPSTYDWCKDQVFMEKYTKTYLTKLLDFCKDNNIPRTNIIYALDCRHNDNWRVQTTTGYKGTRSASHQRNDFHNFDIFPYTRKVILANEQKSQGSLVMYHPNLEADDIIALLTKYIKINKLTNPLKNTNIFILATDRDYVQLCDTNVHLFDITKKPISNILLSSYTSAKDYLLEKILVGDIADNIPGCVLTDEFIRKHKIKQTKKVMLVTKTSRELLKTLFTTESIRQDLYNILDSCNEFLLTMPEPEFETELKISADVDNLPINSVMLPTHYSGKYFKDNQFLKNARVIDFNNIPKNIATDMTEIIKKVLC